MFGDSGIAVIPDGVDLDATRGELGEVHVARGPGAEKHDVLKRVAAIDQVGRQIGMVVDADVVAPEHPRQVFRWIGLPIDVDRRIVGAHHALPNRRELIVAVEEKRFHPPHPNPLPAQRGQGDRR